MEILRVFLLPLSLIYGFITFLRNKLYDSGIFKSYKIPKKSICIGNLSTGGTGKTPHVAYLAEYFKDKIETAILSRGYGRNTKGFILLNENHTSQQVGDEPLFYKILFKNQIHVAVCEDRATGIQALQKQFPENEMILLDDAFQHRKVQAGFSILLTNFNSPFSKDFVLPAGNLREWKSGRKRADCLIITKCPSNQTESQKIQFAKELKVNRDELFFSSIKYGSLKSLGNKLDSPESVLLVTGIANPEPLKDFLSKTFNVEHLKFKDHHQFNEQDIQQIHQKFDTFTDDKKILVTTEKDFMRLKDKLSKSDLEKYPWYFQPITVEIDEEEKFKELINSYVDTI